MADPKMKPPSHLSKPAAAWWREVAVEFAADSHHRHLLTLACEALDRCRAARRAIDRHGLTYTDRFGAPRTRPEVAVERDSRLAFARLLAQLGLDEDSPLDGRTAPRAGKAGGTR